MPPRPCASRAFCACGRKLVEVGLHVELLVRPLPEQLDDRIDQPRRLHGVDGLGLRHVGRLDGPLGAALELDAQVQPAAQDERDDAGHDDHGRDREPHPPAPDEVELGLAPVEALDRRCAPVPHRAGTPCGRADERADGVVDRQQLAVVVQVVVAHLHVIEVPVEVLVASSSTTSTSSTSSSHRRRPRRRSRCACCRSRRRHPPRLDESAPCVPGPTRRCPLRHRRPSAAPAGGLSSFPVPRPVMARPRAMPNRPAPCRRSLRPSRMTSGRV